MSKPRVSVVICTRGRPALLMRAVRSVLAQSVADFELLVIVDGPDPATEQALRQVTDPRLRVHVNSHNLGAGPSRDVGAGLATAEWVAFLDDDDEWLPSKLELQLQLAAEGPAVITSLTEVVTPQSRQVMPVRPYDNRQPFDEWMYDRSSWFGRGDGFFQTSSLMLPRRLFAQLGFGRAQHEDWEIGIRAIKQSGLPLRTVMQPVTVHHHGEARPSLSRNAAWASSVAWADDLGSLMTRRAYSGFLLVTTSRAAQAQGERSAALPLLKRAVAKGRPTLRQLFAYAAIWLAPRGVLRQVRSLLDQRGAGPWPADRAP